ncbi:MAG: hypothetical protein ACR9NN_17570 [Nostochopsis sp.]
MQEVVQQVKDLGGSPARMLFALNRIDVFRADRNWPETENRFVENTIRSIKNELTEQLKPTFRTSFCSTYTSTKRYNFN